MVYGYTAAGIGEMFYSYIPAGIGEMVYGDIPAGIGGNGLWLYSCRNCENRPPGNYTEMFLPRPTFVLLFNIFIWNLHRSH